MVVVFKATALPEGQGRVTQVARIPSGGQGTQGILKERHDPASPSAVTMATLGVDR